MKEYTVVVLLLLVMVMLSIDISTLDYQIDAAKISTLAGKIEVIHLTSNPEFQVGDTIQYYRQETVFPRGEVEVQWVVPFRHQMPDTCFSTMEGLYPKHKIVTTCYTTGKVVEFFNR